jgi:hypothetical protein
LPQQDTYEGCLQQTGSSGLWIGLLDLNTVELAFKKIVEQKWKGALNLPAQLGIFHAPAE